MSALVVATRGPRVEIGKRWSPERVVRDDRAAGRFEMVNPMADGEAGYIELTTQRALLEAVRDARTLARIERARTAQRVGAAA
ncbi:MAG TPA: hypothetical protein VF453_07690 [Burkholderiaceae bacterium]